MTFSKNSMGWLAFACSITLVGMFAGNANATLLWYDGFTTTDTGGDYVVDTHLDGQSGGAGSFFTGPWVAAGYPDVNGGGQNTKSTSDNLTRPGIATVGGAAAREAPPAFESRTSRLMTDPWSGFTNPDGTFYVSFMVNFGLGDAGDAHHRVFEMHVDGLDDSQRTLMMGMSSFVGEIGNNLGLAVTDANDNSLNAVSFSEGADLDDLAVQGSHLIAMKFELSNSGNDVISAYLDPVGTTEPAPSAQVSVVEFLADRMSTLVQFVYNTDDSGRGIFDEIRVGTEFADVAVNTLEYKGVPEPSSLLLAGLSAIGMGLIRRRKQ